MHGNIFILKLPTKLLKTSHVSLFNLLPTHILAGIDICQSSLEHCIKFRYFMFHFKYTCNPGLFAIPHNLWTTYHNVGALRWYNKVKYNWAHRHILARENNRWRHYQHYPNKSEYITQLTPDLLRHHELYKLIHKPSQDENSSILYFK